MFSKFNNGLDHQQQQIVTSKWLQLKRVFAPATRCVLLVALLINLFAAQPTQASQPHANTWPTRAQAIARALDWLRTQQQQNGGFGSRTVDVVHIIARAGENPDGPRWTRNGVSALAFLRGQAATMLTDAGRTGKTLRAAALARQNVRDFGGVDLISRINSFYDASTGLFHPGQLFYHALAVQSLRVANEPVPEAAVHAIINLQHATGGWEWRIGGTNDEVDTTGLMMQTLAQNGVPVTRTTFTLATNFLANIQRADGGWNLSGTGETNSNSTALALNGLLAAKIDPLAPPFTRNGRTPLDALLAMQSADGGFNYQANTAGERLMATLDALDALLQPFPGDVLPQARVFLPQIHAH